ncbi:E3 ubiquitin-protein ligase TRAIP [Lepisosteus oculatus]|uniref:TRAF-interacting protein n=1 Tax=Lepisosteus oculatus TaxID=7918 RepID=W5MY34_LEPOC|nr:PREDICTED: E3 ubiquitin-protein ligase TRAIP [Lepisosteus oculatus]XP_015202801.1 PREDICTED: E3 ubiquitin-protein ligase TRAIP [Lepisosteus oculatus]
MPIRAYCTICSDFFDHSKDVAAIHCGHTFHYDCLLQWFQSAPSKTCPQCRKQVSTKHIINKLFFDVGGEEDSARVDPESLQNELDKFKALLSVKEKDRKGLQKVIEALRETVGRLNIDLECVKKELSEKDMLCAALRKQMKFLENQQSETQSAKEEARRLRTKMKTYESLDLLLQGQRSEVEAMIRDMGVGQAAVEQLSIFCISLKKEYENLKISNKTSNEMCEKLKREVFVSNNKLQKSALQVSRTKEELNAAQEDLKNADKQISSLQKKVEFLQKALSTPSRTNEAISRMVFESPAPLELKQPRLHQPEDSQDVDLSITFDIETPEQQEKKSIPVPSKKMRLEPAESPTLRHIGNCSTEKKNSRARDEEEISLAPLLYNSLLFRKKTFGSMLDPQRTKVGTVRTGFDGLGGRTKFIQPSPLSEIRPLMMKAKRKKVSRPSSSRSASNLLKLDSFLE